MDGLKKLINRHLEDFPEFVYYLPIIDKAERNEIPHPDISIECCNSLIQGICKTIIIRLDPLKTATDLKKSDTQDLVKPALKLLKHNDDVVEDDFVRRSVSITFAISTLRNARGDISHGKAVPKELQSDKELARMVLEMTATLLRYTLACFYALEFEKKERETIFEEPPEDESQEISYEANSDFNNYIDELYPLKGKPLYSLALFQQFREDYEVQLSDYQYEQEIEGL